MADMIETSDFRNGMKIMYNDKPFVILFFQHIKPGKGSSFTRTRIQSIMTGQVLEPTFKSGEKMEKADIDERTMQYLYKEGDGYVFMDNKDFEQMALREDQLGDSKNYLKENIETYVMFFNGRAIGVTLPNSVDLKVVTCDPGVRGDTVSGAMKPAILESGYTINVPLFINQNDVLKIDTRTGEYLTRVSVG